MTFANFARFAVNYDAIADNYDNDRSASPRVVSQIVERLANRRIQSILEVGCGTANHLLALSAALKAHGYGLDRSAPMLEQGQRKSNGLRLIQADATATLPFPEASFDLVCSVNFIHYLRDLPGFFAEVFRVLRPGGVVVTVTDSYDDIYDRTQSKYFPETVDIELQRYHPIAVIEDAMRRAGLVDVELSHTEHTFIMDEGHLAKSRNKAFSSLRLISEESFQAGLARLTADVRQGICVGNELYTYVWGCKPSASNRD